MYALVLVFVCEAFRFLSGREPATLSAFSVGDLAAAVVPTQIMCDVPQRYFEVMKCSKVCPLSLKSKTMGTFYIVQRECCTLGWNSIPRLPESSNVFKSTWKCWQTLSADPDLEGNNMFTLAPTHYHRLLYRQTDNTLHTHC